MTTRAADPKAAPVLLRGFDCRRIDVEGVSAVEAMQALAQSNLSSVIGRSRMRVPVAL